MTCDNVPAGDDLGPAPPLAIADFAGTLSEWFDYLEAHYRVIAGDAGIHLWGRPVVGWGGEAADGIRDSRVADPSTLLLFWPQSAAEFETMKAAKAWARNANRGLSARTMTARARVAAEVRELVGSLGWTLTAAEERLLEDVEHVRTPVAARASAPRQERDAV